MMPSPLHIHVDVQHIFCRPPSPPAHPVLRNAQLGGGGVVGVDFFPPPLQIYSSSPPAKGWLASQCGPHAEPYSQLEVPPIYTWKRRSTTRARPSAC